MQIKDIDFPEAILNALQNNTLVIFAGAGVSYPAPSNLPDFKKLVAGIIDRPLTKEEEREPLDRLLGKQEKKGIKIHQRAKNILSNPKSAPNELHKNLLSLFSSHENIRLVTTNQDKHFTTSNYDLFEKDQVEIYYAPALPLGNDFAGIVYLHGSVNKDVKRMVFTDRDFGRAYLTEGWARRFLQEMFATFTVLFVGYSHDDLVTKYLARGLPADSQQILSKKDMLSQKAGKMIIGNL